MQDIVSPEDCPKAFERALNSGDLEQIALLYDDAAAVRGSTGDVGHGRGVVRDEMGMLIAAKAHITNTLRHTLRCGDTAFFIV